LINAARNTGGSIGISLINNVLWRREQFHQNITIRPFGRGMPPVPSISVPFLMTRIPSVGDLMVVSEKSVSNL
jgi:hypothetical protein